MHSLKNSLTCKVFQIQIYFSTMKYVLLKTEEYFQKMHFNIRKSGGRKNRHLSCGARKTIQSSSHRFLQNKMEKK